MVRRSGLAADDYVTRYFDTGGERQRDLTGNGDAGGEISLGR
ncbi:hypothetical protein GCM10009678_04280 [Actinomadura kijaniata]